MSRLLLAAVVAASAIPANADIIVNFNQIGTGVSVTFSGTGTVDTMGGFNPGTVLNFNNFNGDPFAGLTGSNSFTLTSALTLSGTDASNGGDPYTSVISSLVLENAGVGTSDLDLIGSFSIQHGDTYAASGQSIIDGLLFADLIAGTYTSTEADAADFGEVTLNINASAAVPEPGALPVLIGVALIFACRLRFRLRRKQSVNVSASE